MRLPRRGRVLAVLVGMGTLLAPGTAPAQSDINIYRYVLDTDVPEAPALVALDETPTRVLLGAAPKPLMATVLATMNGREIRPGLSLDVAPYFLLGGGIRSLESYRSNSVAGRLMRVLTKTTLSAAVLPDPTAPDALRVGFGLRSTFHDPHDPILNSRLPEQVTEELARHGVAEPAGSAEDVTGRGVDLSPLYAETLRTLRARGDVRVSGGWGFSARAERGVLGDDGLQDFRHTLWLSGQYALGPRFDLLATLQGLDVFGSDRALRAGAGVLRKTRSADFRAELAYDGGDERLHPAVAADLKVLPCMSVSAALATAPDPVTDAQGLRVQVHLRGYFAQCR